MHLVIVQLLCGTWLKLVLIQPGVWHDTVWVDRTWHTNIWLHYGTVAVAGVGAAPIPPKPIQIIRQHQVWILQPVHLKPFSKIWQLIPSGIFTQSRTFTFNPPKIMDYEDLFKRYKEVKFELEYYKKIEKLREEAK